MFTICSANCKYNISIKNLVRLKRAIAQSPFTTKQSRHIGLIVLSVENRVARGIDFDNLTSLKSRRANFNAFYVFWNFRMFYLQSRLQKS